ncbi:pectin lyase-like protein [Choiromyces venosus 120613-1]|uniref:galacturonan 1,4-alpha-galacturonidase n=1 Tax=Choiromyces venosus 120613-1 TaxID=1336337 RepID=A0A3N4JEL2_9PEZI|nr:pectin lyase-like protein [Choiromyces venosus 120613-1]
MMGLLGGEILDPNNQYLRPALFTAVNATGLSIQGITMRNSPCWANFLITSKDIYYDDVLIEAQSINKNRSKNSDCWDTYNVDGLTVTNSRVNIGDDCFSAKPNTTNIFLQNLWCNGTHGVSMGSIGQYPGVMDIIENVYIENITMLNAQNGARLKTWAGPNIGYGRINNVTYKDFYVDNVDYPLILTQCYSTNKTECAKHPSEVNFSNITFLNFSGMSSGKRGRLTAEVICSPNAVCENIFMEDIDIHSPVGEPAAVTCDGVTGDIGIDCVAENSTEARDALATTIGSGNL